MLVKGPPCHQYPECWLSINKKILYLLGTIFMAKTTPKNSCLSVNIGQVTRRRGTLFGGELTRSRSPIVYFTGGARVHLNRFDCWGALAHNLSRLLISWLDVVCHYPLTCNIILQNLKIYLFWPYNGAYIWRADSFGQEIICISLHSSTPK